MCSRVIYFHFLIGGISSTIQLEGFRPSSKYKLRQNNVGCTHHHAVTSFRLVPDHQQAGCLSLRALKELDPPAFQKTAIGTVEFHFGNEVGDPRLNFSNTALHEVTLRTGHIN